MERIEQDALGKRAVPADALYGIHSVRAVENFPSGGRFSYDWFRAMGQVKEACYAAYGEYRKAVLEKYPGENAPVELISGEILGALEMAAREVGEGAHFSDFIVPAVSGGAGTSINMNVNEIIANVALRKTGHPAGDYEAIDPIQHANVFQSTNDVVPTALKVAAMHLLNRLEQEVNALRSEMERLESLHRSALRIGFTQMQEAVPSTFGKLFGAYSEALSRDWWRISKCVERIKPVNLGGSAIGTGLAVPRFFIMEVVTALQRITGLPVARSENMADTTSNLDAFTEIHATVKAHAVNLEKIASDIRHLASDLGPRELVIPPVQVGSSIMPGKINPVIPEYAISVAHRVYANDTLVASLCGQGCLELNAYLPAIGNALLDSLELLISADETMRKHLLAGLEVHADTGEERLLRSPSVTTALIPFIGYHKAGELASEMKKTGSTILEANHKRKLIPEEKLRDILKPENLVKLGYTLGDLET